MSLGQIKDYTPNFNLIIPRFDIATWHDYMESNFRSIDALFFNMFGINQYRGEWQNSTTYQVGDVLFIGDPNSQYTGRLVKVLVAHTTTANDSFDVYYAHNPINYDLFMDAAAAEQAAKLARDWAIKTDGKVQGIDYSSKYYANLITPISTEIVNVSNISNEVVNVSSISSNITSVDANSTNINTVASMKPDIDDVVAIKSDIEWIADNDSIVTNVSNNSTKITTVANNINSVNTNATNITDINTNASNISSINTTATNISNINTTALNINDINTASSISNDITIVANIASDVTSVVNNATNINSVAANNTNISAVANNETNINTVATNSSNINTVSTNISDVNTAATNIVAIQNALTYATNAANSASLAQDWAVKMDGLVSGEDYSAKYWADQARQSATGAVVDEISINRNTDDELQTIGVINQNATTIAIKTWTGTLAQYNAIVTKDSNTLYNITDDMQAVTYEAYSKNETYNRNEINSLVANNLSTLLSNLYPIGSIYISTQLTCPLETLISGSTWVKVATSLVTDVSIPSTIAVYGNGKTLGLTDGTYTAGITLNNNYNNQETFDRNQYNKNIGTAVTSHSWFGNTNKGVGVVQNTDGTSGLIAKSNSITKTSITINIWQRTA